MQSYISDLSDCDDFPMRSYSVGAAAKSKFLFDQDHRARAFSCGSHDDAAKNKQKDLKSEAMSIILSEEHDQKSISIPHLPGQKSHTYGGSRQEDLMELEFMPDSVSSTCSQASSVSSISGRSRSGSKSSSSRFKVSGSKYRSGDSCEQPVACVTCPAGIESTSPIESAKMEPPDHFYKIVTGHHIADKIAPKMSPSQELVQHLVTSERQNKSTDVKLPIREAVQTSDISDEAGEYINIDFKYTQQGNQKSLVANLPKHATRNTQPLNFPSKSSALKSHEYANLDFSRKPPEVTSTDLSDSSKIKQTNTSDTAAHSIIKQQSMPAVLSSPSMIARSPVRKSSCPVTSTQSYEADNKTGRKYSLEPPLTYENISFAHTQKSPFNSRPSSVCSELELNYASLDLAPTSREDERLTGRSSPRSMTSQNSSTNNISFDEGESTGLSYAKIDFTRSEGLRATTNSVVENKH